jgi:hypothetical protein
MRMEDTKVFVINEGVGREHLCGVLKVRWQTVWSLEGQTYKIRCNLLCGDKVKLTVRHDQGEYDIEGCIHMKEIMAYETGYTL